MTIFPGVRERTATVRAGLAVALLAPLAYSALVAPIVRPHLHPTVHDLVGLSVMWLLAAGVVAVLLLGERRPLTDIGVRSPALRGAALALAVGVLLSLLVPVLSVLTDALLPGVTGTGILDAAAARPVWLLALAVLTAGVTEEVLFRGYAISRLPALGIGTWPAALLTLAAFTLLHVPTWGVGHAVGVALPLGAVLTGLFLWRRNLVVVILAHAMVDLPLVVLALLGP